MPIDNANIDQLALICEGHFASAKRDNQGQALLAVLPAADICEAALSNAPGCSKYLIDGKLAILSTVRTSPAEFCDTLIGYFKTRAHAAVVLGMVAYAGENDIRFRQTESPLGTIAVTTALTNLQEARQLGKPYVISDLSTLADLHQ